MIGKFVSQKFNIDKRKVHLSALIRTSEITREDAQKQLLASLYEESEFQRDFEFVCKKLNFSAEELEDILAKSPADHLSYKSDRIYIEPLLKLAKRIGMATFK